jgi:hypothetical protein
MARLTPKEPEFKLYDTGFDGDLLDRKASGAALSNLVEQIEDPMVIALDGGWGTGKSWFLKRWVGQHRIDHPGEARTVYFDAFAHDYLDEPLVALMGVLSAELSKEQGATVAKLAWLQKKAFQALPGISKLGANIATGFAVKALDDAGDIIAEAIGGSVEGSSEAFWQAVANQRTAMAEFGAALQALTLPAGAEGEPRKLVIVVDELDRCRPDYALSLLEVIKHFFAVDHVHFVLGVNLRELENMVRVRYGTQEGAELYLQKFVTLTMDLPEMDVRVSLKNGEHTVHVPSLVEHWTGQLAISPDWVNALHAALTPLYVNRGLTPRSIERIVVQAAVASTVEPLPKPNGKGPMGTLEFVESQERLDQALMVLIALKVMNPSAFRDACALTLTADSLMKIWGISDEHDRFDAVLYEPVRTTISTFFPSAAVTEPILTAPLRNAYEHIPRMAQHYLAIGQPQAVTDSL